MPTITVTAPPPYGKIPVNTDMIYAIVDDPVGKGSRLLIDTAGGRAIQAEETIDQFEDGLKKFFARFDRASIDPGPVLINRLGWVSIVPHPQVSGVTQINFKNHYVPVKATVDQVSAVFGKGR